jgi:ParB-like chromosome segregation protein Spo0J
MLTIQYKKIDELIPYARNSRTHSDAQVAQIAASIKEFGWTLIKSLVIISITR